MKQPHKNTKECPCGKRHWQDRKLCAECRDKLVIASVVMRGPKEDSVVNTFVLHRDGPNRNY